jgi:hypothetical protein
MSVGETLPRFETGEFQRQQGARQVRYKCEWCQDLLAGGGQQRLRRAELFVEAIEGHPDKVSLIQFRMPRDDEGGNPRIDEASRRDVVKVKAETLGDGFLSNQLVGDVTVDTS